MRSKKRACQVTLLALVTILCLLGGISQPVSASTLDAEDFYNTYGDTAVFEPTTYNDGEISFASYVYLRSPGTKIYYTVLGWGFTFSDLSGNTLQTVVCSFEGNYLKIANIVSYSDRNYYLYTIKLSELKYLLSQSTLAMLNSGQCQVTMNAYVRVCYYGTYSGSMDTDGTVHGTLYSDYNSLVTAQDWSSKTKNSLKSYFNKEIDGLYRRLRVRKGLGIASVTGDGTYCYGADATITATPQTGYQFDYWVSDDTSYYNNPQSVCVNDDVLYRAYAYAVYTKATFYRNYYSTDSTSNSKYYYYNGSNQTLLNPGWTKTGYTLSGWATSKTAYSATYSLTNAVDGSWVLKYTPSVNLYAVWKANSYTLRFYYNDGSSGSSQASVTYSSSVTMPTTPAKTAGGSVLIGWNTKADGSGTTYLPGATVWGSSLAQTYGVAGTNGAGMSLYAMWDGEPTLEVKDQYLTLEDAKAGLVTEAYLAGLATAYDEQDGVISYGSKGTTSLRLVSFQASDYLNLTGSTTVSETYEVTDSAGHVVTATIYIHIVDSTPQLLSDTQAGRVRLIGSAYYSKGDGSLIESSRGGLSETSIWRTSSYGKLLQQALETR